MVAMIVLVLRMVVVGPVTVTERVDWRLVGATIIVLVLW